MRSTSDCTPRSASCSWRTSCSTRRWTTWRPAALWLGGGRRDEWRPVDLRPSGVRRTTGLPRVGTGAVQRLRATARDAVARLTAPRAGRCRHGRGAGRPHPPGARGLTVSWRRVPESVGEAAGREDPHLAGTGATVDAGARPPGPVPRGSCTRRERHHGGPQLWGTDMVHGDGRRGGGLRLRGRRSLYECIGLHAAKRGTRFEALEPIRQGVRKLRPIGDGVADGLRLRTTTARTTWLTPGPGLRVPRRRPEGLRARCGWDDLVLGR